MFAKLIDFVLAQRTFVLLMIAVLIAFGCYALSNLPIEAFPDVQDVQVIIVTQYPGQAAEEIERTVSIPIEREMSGVPRQTQLRSVTITGLSVVTITFSDGTDDYFARQQVLEKLQNVNLPPGVQPSIAPLTTSVGEIFRYVIDAPPSMSTNDVRALQDWVMRPNLRMVPGVADVVSFGGTIREYQVQIDPYKLKRYGVTLKQVSDSLQSNGANVGGGFIRHGDEALIIRGIGLFNSLNDIGRVSIVAKSGKTVLVSDVADVQVGSRPRFGIVAYDKQASVVTGIVQMTKGGNANKVITALKVKLEEMQGKLPSGVKIKPIYDRTELLNHTIATVSENLMVGATLVIVLLIIFLRNWRAALIVATVIPLSLLIAFIGLNVRNVPANVISMGAVDFGIIIDGAVVLVEALMVRLSLQPFDTRLQSSQSGWRIESLKQTVAEMGHPILFSKAIIITAFIPIFTFQRVEAKIFAPVALTLSFAMLGALLLTLTLVPTLLAITMKKHSMEEIQLKWMYKLQSFYRSTLAWAIEQRVLVLLISIGALLIILLFSPLLGSEFLPKLDEGNIWLTISLPPSTSLDSSKGIETRVRAMMGSYPETKHIISHVGRPDDGTDPKGSNNIEMLIDLKPRDTWRFRDKEALIKDMARTIHTIPGVPTNFSQVMQDNVEEALSGVKGEIAIKVFGPNLEVLGQKTEQIASILNRIRGSTDVAAIRIGGQSELNVVIDREKIARLGINIADVNFAIQAALQDFAVGSFYDGDKRFDVTMRLKADYRNSIDDIANVQISLPNNTGTVNMGDIANIEIKQGATRISREAGGRHASVKANLIGRDQGGFVKEAQEAVRREVHLPPGYNITWGGQFENQQRAVKRLMIIVPLTIFLIFSLLFSAFKSVANAFMILAMIPFTMIGGVTGLALAGLHFSISAAVGFIAVAGVAVQNGVIMVEKINENARKNMSLVDSAIEGAVSRLRPVVMTALMAGLGLLPAALSHGIGSETQRPFAVVIVGGIVSATFFTLVLLPLVYPYFQRSQPDKP